MLTNPGFCGSSGLLDHVTLPVSGTYTLLLDPVWTSTGTATLTVYTFTDVTGAITPNGSNVPVTIASPGQNAGLTFSGTAGQIISALATNVTWGGCYAFYLGIVNPDGSMLTNSGFCGASGSLTGQTLPISGTYTVLFDPIGVNTGSVTLTVTSP